MRKLCLLLAFAGSALAQQSYRAVRTDHPPVIDGALGDAAWSAAPELTGFTQMDPDEGKPETEKTVVKIVYDDDAIYFGAYLHDAHPVTTRLGRRDTTIESDWFRVYLDPQLDRRSGATFQVNAANVQYDASISSDSIMNVSWDAVWASSTKIVADGWIVEMAIPFSQLRFPNRPVHTWGINLARVISRRNEVTRLVYTPKKEAGFVSRFALLTGIEGIRPRHGLELLPYTSARADNDARAIGDQRDVRGGAGLDVKYALPGNLTLTGTINPDFGQVEVDPARVNLTQYELFFPEKRPFFVEGASLFDPDVPSNHVFSFNFDQPLMFYSRRIGRQPQAAALLGATSAPNETTILGAAKITGKTAGGWTIAALDAVTADEQGTMELGNGIVRDTVEPLTNYLVSRFAKDFGAKSSAGFRFSSVTRELPSHLEPLLRSAAYSAAADGYRIFGDNTYVLQWSASGTRVDGSPAAIARTQRSPARYYQRPDADHLDYDPTRTSLSGYGGTVMFAKHAGKWQYNLESDAFSPGYETNDVGFMTRSDILTTHAVLLYVDPDPWRNTRKRTVWVGKFQHWNWGGDMIQNGLWYDSNTTFNSYRRAYAWGGVEWSTIDDRATRGGPAIRSPRREWSGVQFGTDTRKPLSYDVWTEQLRYERDGWDNVYAASATWRPSASLSLKLTPSFRTSRYPQQYVLTSGTHYVFSQIDQKIVDIAARADYTFTSRLSLQVYVQPYVAAGHYHDFKEVGRPRSHEFIPYTGSTLNPDFNYRSVRGNAVLRWEFRPGSALYAVWNESREDELPIGDFRLARDVRDSFAAPAHDVFMVKVSYWLPL